MSFEINNNLSKVLKEYIIWINNKYKIYDKTYIRGYYHDLNNELFEIIKNIIK